MRFCPGRSGGAAAGPIGSLFGSLLIMMSFTSTFEIFFKDAPILDAADDLPSRRGAGILETATAKNM
jgi:hypothetical protein